MASLDDFLKDSPQLAKSTKRAGDSVTLDVVITSYDDHAVDFIYLGRHFSALREEVIEVAAGTQQAASPQRKPAVLTLKPTARLEWKQYLTASELDLSLPFGFALPTAAPRLQAERPSVAAWSTRVGYPLQTVASNVVGTGTTCDSYSDGVSDDSKFDDW